MLPYFLAFILFVALHIYTFSLPIALGFYFCLRLHNLSPSSSLPHLNVDVFVVAFIINEKWFSLRFGTRFICVETENYFQSQAESVTERTLPRQAQRQNGRIRSSAVGLSIESVYRACLKYICVSIIKRLLSFSSSFHVKPSEESSRACGKKSNHRIKLKKKKKESCSDDEFFSGVR